MIIRGEGDHDHAIYQDGEYIGDLGEADEVPFIEMADWAGEYNAAELREIADFLDHEQQPPVPPGDSIERNALKWIAHTAYIHYAGQAFEPVHMRGIGNLALAALAGEDDLPDFDAAMAEAAVKAKAMYEALNAD